MFRKLESWCYSVNTIRIWCRLSNLRLWSLSAWFHIRKESFFQDEFVDIKYTYLIKKYYISRISPISLWNVVKITFTSEFSDEEHRILPVYKKNLDLTSILALFAQHHPIWRFQKRSSPICTFIQIKILENSLFPLLFWIHFSQLFLFISPSFHSSFFFFGQIIVFSVNMLTLSVHFYVIVAQRILLNNLNASVTAMSNSNNPSASSFDFSNHDFPIDNMEKFSAFEAYLSKQEHKDAFVSIACIQKCLYILRMLVLTAIRRNWKEKYRPVRGLVKGSPGNFFQDIKLSY